MNTTNRTRRVPLLMLLSFILGMITARLPDGLADQIRVPPAIEAREPPTPHLRFIRQRKHDNLEAIQARMCYRGTEFAVRSSQRT